MSDLSTFSGAAKGLARNPLGIIALFIILIYGFAAITLGVNAKLESAERAPLVWFLVLFPVAVLILFGWLVSGHHEKLYAPGDFRSDESFHQRKENSERRVAEITAEQDNLKARLRETILDTSLVDGADKSRLEQVADQAVAAVDLATNITVDARAFLGDDSAIFTYPVAAFESLGDFTNEVYFKLSSKVRPYQYGHSWLLQNKQTNAIIKTLRMLVDAPPGKPLPDPRPLSEVGISPGITLLVQGLK
ncbi:hypothetical protein [Janthinobacterium sp.]|uniref:hypothetical protein n=1 Tax=Janthinobacterium sp. TaxID=1871054 RepID=UPI00258A449B|nr:hypothetical protein [Janthinobacterium sp.]MCX7292075.1 hypothetical protein [Janthinobacterium sp.]